RSTDASCLRHTLVAVSHLYLPLVLHYLLPIHPRPSDLSTLPLHDALPIYPAPRSARPPRGSSAGPAGRGRGRRPPRPRPAGPAAIGRAHVCTPVTLRSRMTSSA